MTDLPRSHIHKPLWSLVVTEGTTGGAITLDLTTIV